MLNEIKIDEDINNIVSLKEEETQAATPKEEQKTV